MFGVTDCQASQHFVCVEQIKDAVAAIKCAEKCFVIVNGKNWQELAEKLQDNDKVCSICVFSGQKRIAETQKMVDENQDKYSKVTGVTRLERSVGLQGSAEHI